MSQPETPSSPVPQAVIVTDLNLTKLENLPNTTLLSSTINRIFGAFQSVQTSTGLIVASLPVPMGRVPNYSLQKKVMEEAELFIFLVSTLHFSKSNLVKCPRDVPSVCWIDNSNEAQASSEWKRKERMRLLAISRTAHRTEEDKRHEAKPRYVSYYRLESFPITSFEKVETIVRSFRPETEVFSCSSTSLFEVLNQGKEVSPEFMMEWERMLKRATELHHSQRPDRQAQS